ncbi:MAG: ABC-2 family transporter protein [Verrucomicrobia bacterium]|nr:ABC-2 family transporter protein [Verrucomicrobiota bacterium]
MQYSKAFSLGVQNTLVYRWNFLIRALFGLVPVGAALYLWAALYEARGSAEVGGYTFQMMVTYFIVLLVAENLVVPVEDEWQIAADIREGRLSAFLLRPVDYPTFRLMLFPSSRLVYTAVAIVPIALLIAAVWKHLVFPGELLLWVVGGVSLLLAGLLQFFISFMLATLAFWFLEISTLVFIVYSFEYFLSGRLFPLDLMPPFFRELSFWMPFQYEMYFPVAVLVGRLRGPELWQGFAMQIAWTLLAWQLSRWLWARGLRHYQASGG